MPEPTDIFDGATRLDLREDLMPSAPLTREDVAKGQPDMVRSRAERTLEGLEPVTPYLYDEQARYPLLMEQEVPVIEEEPDLPDGVTFAVKVVLSGGDPGTETTRATYVYDVYDINNQLLGEDMSPQKQRSYGHMTHPNPLDYGIAFYDENSELTLWDANETYSTIACPD